MERKKSYDAILFRQRANAPLQVAFAAPSSEVDAWARVPTKRTGNVRNFQRAKIDKHIKEVATFFNDPSNSSPTAVVVGFDIIRANGRVHTLIGDKQITDADVKPGVPVTGRLEISWDTDSDPQTPEQYIEAILASAPRLQQFVYSELKDITGIDPGVVDEIAKIARERIRAGIEPDLETEEVVEEGENTEEDEPALEIEIPPDIRAKLPGLSPSEQQVVVGRLFFLAQIDAEFLKDKSTEDLESIYREVQDELKPGILIDGQHRILGTKNAGIIPFLVTALPNAAWPELAFQFIVTNRTAKKVPESLLISIVGNSLSKKQRGDIEERLREAGIRVGLIEAVMRIHEDELSPFYGWLAFGIKNEQGFLDAAAMRGKVIQPWYERLPPILQLFEHLCQGRRRSDRTEYWKSEELWFQYFLAFWTAVKERYKGTSVFSSELVTNPRTKKKDPHSKLMTATVLKIFQDTVLRILHDYVKGKENTERTPISDSLPNEAAFSTMVKNLLEPLTPDFFDGWTITGFDGSAGARDDLASAIRQVIKKEKSVAKLKGGKNPHRLYKAEA